MLVCSFELVNQSSKTDICLGLGVLFARPDKVIACFGLRQRQLWQQMDHALYTRIYECKKCYKTTIVGPEWVSEWILVLHIRHAPVGGVHIIAMRILLHKHTSDGFVRNFSHHNSVTYCLEGP